MKKKDISVKEQKNQERKTLKKENYPGKTILPHLL